MKILVLTTSFPTRIKDFQLGGSFILTECLAYEQAGAEVTVITPGVYGVPQSEVFGRNIRVIRFAYFFPESRQIIKKPGVALYNKMGLLFYIQFPFFLLFYMSTALKNGRNMDIVHCNWTLSALVALPLKWIYKVPIVLTMRGSDIRSIPKFINSYIVKNIDKVIDCFGPYPENVEIKKMFDGNYLTLPVIVKSISEESCDTFVRSGKFVITYIGRFDETKLRLGFGFFDLMEALSLIEERSNIECIYVGDGSLMEGLLARAQKLGLEDCVRFVGYQESVYKYIDYSDVIVGGAALNGVSEECTLKGKPQLLPDIKKWQENLWSDKNNCLIYKTGDPASMAEAIKYAMANPEKMNELKENIYEVSRKYLITGKAAGELYTKEFEKLTLNS